MDDSKTAATGTLSYSDETGPLHLTDYFWAHPTVFGVDRISRGFAGSTVPDGAADFIGRLSLTVKRPMPRVSISVLSTNVTISSPAWAVDYGLQAVEHLSASANWLTVTNAPASSGDRTYVVLPFERETQFYRLGHTSP